MPRGGDVFRLRCLTGGLESGGEVYLVEEGPPPRDCRAAGVELHGPTGRRVIASPCYWSQPVTPARSRGRPPHPAPGGRPLAHEVANGREAGVGGWPKSAPVPLRGTRPCQLRAGHLAGDRNHAQCSRRT